jgi:hypothetical protein
MKIIFVLLVVFVLLAASGDKIKTKEFDVSYICIEGHVYYFITQYGGLDFIVPKLDDNGKPVPCEADDYK